MRIISGEHKGRKISSSTKLSVRPTTDRAKEALFNILENYYCLNKISVLDLFTGTGNISYEFASRGCTRIISVDQNKSCIRFIQKKSMQLNFNINTIQSDCIKYIKNTKERFDVIFADPPYNYNHYDKLKDLILQKKILKKEGVLILEHDNSISFKNENVNTRKYGNVNFSIFSKFSNFDQ